LTDALDLLLKDNQLFQKATVDEWLDCGTLPAWRETTGVIAQKEFVSVDESQFENTTIHAPVFIGENVTLRNCIIGPYTSIEASCTIEDSTIKNSIIQESTTLANCRINHSTIGKYVELKDVTQQVHIG